jgi:hypothetical protein
LPIGNTPGYSQNRLFILVTFYKEIVDVLMELFGCGIIIKDLKTENAIKEMFTPIQWMKGLFKVNADPVRIWRFLS